MVSTDQSMRAVRLHAPRGEQSEDLRVETVPTPRPGPGQVLVRVQACGLDEADLGQPGGSAEPPPVAPVTIGREAGGVVAALGEQVTDWQPGDRVAVVADQPCGRCGYCAAGRDNLCVARRALGVDLDGALAAFVVADARYLLPVPVGVPIEQAALVTRTVAGPYHALKRGGVGEGVTATVHGLRGRGLHAILLARLTGTAVIGVDTDGERLSRALEWGADAVVDASEGDAPVRVHELTEGGVDRAFEFTGRAETVDTAVRCLRPGGRATITGRHAADLRTVPMARLVADELEVVGSGAPTVQDVGELLDLLDDGRLDLSRSITGRVTIDEVPAALEQLAADAGHPVRTMAVHDDAPDGPSGSDRRLA